MEIALVVASGFVVGYSVIDRFMRARRAWLDSVAHEAKFSWLRIHCSDERFFSNMREHSDVCERAMLVREPAADSAHAALGFSDGEVVVVLVAVAVVARAVHCLCRSKRAYQFFSAV